MKKKLLLIAIVVFALSLCVACGEQSSNSGDEHTHEYVWSFVEGNEPTEEKDGKAQGVCACGEKTNAHVAKLTDTSVWSLETTAATCSAKGAKKYTSKFGEVVIELPIDENAHKLEDVAATGHTCTEAGKVAHKHCEICGKDFDEAGNVLTSVEKPEDPAAHQFINVDAVAPSCDAEGTLAHKHCEICGENYNEAGEKLDNVVIPRSHKLVDVAAEPATCVKRGTIAHKHCSVCGKNFDANGEEITGDVTTPMSPHTPKAVNGKPATCTETGLTDGSVCSVCGTTLTEQTVILAKGHSPEVVSGKPATCTEDGLTDGSVCSVCGDTLTEQTVIPALGHTYNENGECVNCGAAVFADMSFAVVQTSYGTPASKGVLSFKNGTAIDTVFKPNKTSNYDLCGNPCGACKETIKDSKVTVKFIDAAKGIVEIKHTYTDEITHYGCDDSDTSENKTETFNCYLDPTSKFIVSAEKSSAWSYILVPSATEVDLSTLAMSEFERGSNARAIAYENGETSLKFFIEKGVVTFGVDFVDANGDALTVDKFNDSAKTPIFRVVKNGALISSFGYIDNAIVKLDGLEGTYSSTSYIYTFELNGAGTITIGETKGTYVIEDGVVLATIKNDTDEVIAYYEITIGENKTATVVAPTVTVSYISAGVTETAEVCKNVTVTLKSIEPIEQVFDGVTKRFSGWRASDGKTVVAIGEKVVLTADATYTAIWKTVVSYTVKDESGKREDVTVKVVEGESVYAALVEQYGVQIEIDGKKYTAVEWYVLVDGVKIAVEEKTVAKAVDNGAVLYVEWKQPAKVAVVDANSNVTEIELDEGDVIVEKLPAHDGCVGGYKFEGWFKDETFATPITDSTVMSDELGLTVVYAKWTWAGNVKFDLGSYTFVYDETLGVWKSSNTGKNNSSAEFEIIVTEGTAEISFDYFCSSEAAAKWDFLTVWYVNANGEWVSVTDGENKTAKLDGIDSWNWKSLTTHIDSAAEVNKSVRFTYQKDNGGVGGLDTAFIRNLTINGVVITNAAPLDRLGGAYTSGETVLTLNGNGLATLGEANGTYTVIDAASNKVALTIGGVYYEVVLDLTAKTYTDVTPEVTLTFDLKGHGSLEQLEKTVKLNAVVALPAPVAEGYIFRGWFSDETLETAVDNNYVVAATATLYAKWDAAVAINIHYNKAGLTDTVINGKFVNDTLTAAEVGDDPVDPATEGKQVFIAWYTDENLTNAWVAGSVLSDTVLDLYAKWADPSIYAGSYYGVKLTGGSSSYYTKGFTIDDYGVAATISDSGFANGPITFTNDGGELVITNKYGNYYYAKVINGIIFVGGSYYSTQDLAKEYAFKNNICYVYIPTNLISAVSKDTVLSYNLGKSAATGYSKALTLKGLIGVHPNFFISDEEVVGSVTFKSIEGTLINTADAIAEYDTLVVHEGTKFAAIATYARTSVSDDFVVADEYAGGYSAGPDSLTLNGAGVARLFVVDGSTLSGTYEVKTEGENVVAIVLMGETYTKYILNVEAKTCVKDETPVTVNFDLNGKGETVVKTVVKGIPFVASDVYGDNPVSEGFAFKGWYKDAECTTAVGETESVEAETTYYAKWAQIVSVTIVYGNGLNNVSFDIPVGDDLGLSEYVPAYTNGKVFVGWYKDAECTVEFTGSSVDAATTLYVKWIEASPLYGDWVSTCVYSTNSWTRKNNKTAVTTLGEFSGEISGTASGLGANGGYFEVVDRSLKYAAYYDMESGLLVTNRNSQSKDIAIGNSIIVFVRATKIDTPITQVTFDKDSTRIFTIKVDDVEKVIVVHNQKAFMDVDVVAVDANNNELSGISNYSKAAKVTVKRAGTETVLCEFKVSSGTTIAKTDVIGTFTGELGDIVCDGYNVATLGGVDYKLNAAKKTAMVKVGDKYYKVTFDVESHTYTAVEEEPNPLFGKTYKYTYSCSLWDCSKSKHYVEMVFDDGEKTGSLAVKDIGSGGDTFRYSFTYEIANNVLTITITAKTSGGTYLNLKAGNTRSFDISDTQLTYNGTSSFCSYDKYGDTCSISKPVLTVQG